MERILVVDDDRSVRLSLTDILKLEGFEVEAAENGEVAVNRLRDASRPIDLMLLDLRMPVMDGMQVMEAAREISPETQIVLLTAHGSLESAIAALRSGANDYILKPSPSHEIVASIQRALERRRAELRRRGLLDTLESSLRELREPLAAGAVPADKREATAKASDGQIVVGEFTLDPAAHEFYAGGSIVTLTRNEVKLLALLMQQPGEVVSHTEIVREVQGYPASGFEAAEIVRPLVSRLRRKLETLPPAANCLQTVKTSGYRFNRRLHERESPDSP